MRTLFLFRHAKSGRDDPALEDFDRPLNERGRRDAPRMGGEFCGRGWFPQRALVSPALRTRQTWELAGECLPTACETVFERALYAAPPRAMLAAIARVPHGVTSLVVVGHNPGLEELAAQLASGLSDAEALGRLREKFPTAAVARLETDASWARLSAGGARLTHFVTPAMVAGEP